MFARIVLPLALVVLSCTALAEAPIPKRAGPLVDRAHVLSAHERKTLLGKLEQERPEQIRVLIVRSLGKEPIERFAEQVSEAWKLGNNEALLVACTRDSSARIVIGTGLIEKLDETLLQQIVEQDLAPALAQQSYYAGIDGALNRMFSALAPTPAKRPAAVKRDPRPSSVSPKSNPLEFFNERHHSSALLYLGGCILGWILYLVLAQDNRVRPLAVGFLISILALGGFQLLANLSLIWMITMSVAAGTFGTAFLLGFLPMALAAAGLEEDEESRLRRFMDGS